MQELEKYIGIPFRDHGCGYDGCDCYGLVRLVYRDLFNVELPHIGDTYSDAFARGEVSQTVADAVNNGWAVDVTDLLPPQPLDVLVFRRGGFDYHVGLYVRDTTMLHVMSGADSCLDRFTATRWNRQLARRLRHVTRCTM